MANSVFLDTEKLFDVGLREALLDRAFGPRRHHKTCERLREGRLAAEGLSFVARCGDRVIGSLRFWHVNAGGVPALMLGPLAVDCVFEGQGIGSALIREGLQRARAFGHHAVILVGDAPFYCRFGFSADLTHGLVMPGPVEASRFLGLELSAGALGGAKGMVRATGALPLRPANPLPQRRIAA